MAKKKVLKTPIPEITDSSPTQLSNVSIVFLDYDRAYGLNDHNENITARKAGRHVFPSSVINS